MKFIIKSLRAKRRNPAYRHSRLRGNDYELIGLRRFARNDFGWIAKHLNNDF